MKYFFISILTVFLFACNHQTKFNKVSVENKYELVLPDYMQSTIELHEDASLQYQNEERDIYTIVIDESKAEMKSSHLKYNLSTYFEAVASQPFIGSINNGVLSTPLKLQINGASALVADITGNIDHIPIYYKLAVIETKENFYQILTWTGGENKVELSPIIQHTIDSFKELGNS